MLFKFFGLTVERVAAAPNGSQLVAPVALQPGVSRSGVTMTARLPHLNIARSAIQALCAEVRNMRPDLRIEPAFLELSKPSFGTVVDKLVRAGYDEIVVVPLLLTEAYHAKVDVPEARELAERDLGLHGLDDATELTADVRGEIEAVV